MPEIVTATPADSAPSSVVDAARAAYPQWRAWRLESVTGPTGNLSLIETRWLAEGDETTPEAALADRPASVVATTIQRRDLDTGRPQQGIRLWDANAPAIRSFETITAFPFNPAWVIEAEFTPVSSERTVPFEHIRDNGGTRELVVPGDITFSLDGFNHSLSAFDDDGTLLLVFGDASNGVEGPWGTYASGRFLFVHRIDDEPTRVVLDFNRAFVPPCGFSDQYNCPLPPQNNRFAFVVDAGEKRVVFRDGFDLH